METTHLLRTDIGDRWPICIFFHSKPTFSLQTATRTKCRMCSSGLNMNWHHADCILTWNGYVKRFPLRKCIFIHISPTRWFKYFFQLNNELITSDTVSKYPWMSNKSIDVYPLIWCQCSVPYSDAFIVQPNDINSSYCTVQESNERMNHWWIGFQLFSRALWTIINIRFSLWHFVQHSFMKFIWKIWD